MREICRGTCASYINVRNANPVSGNKLIRRIKRLGRARGVLVRLETRYGKGSHGRLYYGDRFTTVKDRKKEIGEGLLMAMLRQLGLTLDELDGRGAECDMRIRSC